VPRGGVLPEPSTQTLANRGDLLLAQKEVAGRGQDKLEPHVRDHLGTSCSTRGRELAQGKRRPRHELGHRRLIS